MSKDKIPDSNDGKCPGCGKGFNDYFSFCMVQCSCGTQYIHIGNGHLKEDLKKKNVKKSKKK
jgi:hypothetical protein